MSAPLLTPPHTFPESMRPADRQATHRATHEGVRPRSRKAAGLVAATVLGLGSSLLGAPGAAVAAEASTTTGATGTATGAARQTPDDLPDQAAWESDVIHVMAGAKDYLADRVADAAPGERLAINLDIDNTSLATYYDRGHPVRKVRNLARLADQMGIAVLFNTGRLERNLRGVDTQLAKVGYDVTQLCTRKLGERLAQGKKRCRRSFVDDGYTLVLNIGNNPTDFRGGDYERAYRLPNYDGRLG